MPTCHPFFRLLSSFGLMALMAGVSAAAPRSPQELVGQWDMVQDGGTRPCRITLSSGRSDTGDYFASVPGPCRRIIPVLARVGRWALSDPTHIVLNDPAGDVLLTLAAEGDGFAARLPDGPSYRLSYVPAVGRSVTGSNAVPDASPAPAAKIEFAATKKAAPPERMSDLAGRYAVMRDKTHDTGCMLTLDDKTRVKSGARASLAPACRDQGIVVFDPSAWQMVNGRLVLTAKAGHMTHLDKQDDGSWLKDASEGKSLSLKKL